MVYLLGVPHKDDTGDCQSVPLREFVCGNWEEYLKGTVTHGGSWGDRTVLVAAGRLEANLMRLDFDPDSQPMRIELAFDTNIFNR